ncbi:hypothetical protein HanRHA438_Chr01g0008491 [Helianthus annuus]|nr:hypothetical protein HanRHA438_Chr01g0008491 [Helianthus annuus]
MGECLCGEEVSQTFFLMKGLRENKQAANSKPLRGADISSQKCFWPKNKHHLTMQRLTYPQWWVGGRTLEKKFLVLILVEIPIAPFGFFQPHPLKIFNSHS